MKEELPLEELNIEQIYFDGSSNIEYQIPIYQRNYAWEDTEINDLVKDIMDSVGKKSVYYIGTLVTYKRGENIYEVIDGQQRLTTINLILNALDKKPKNTLTYTARQVSKKTIEKLPEFPEVYDKGIKNGFDFAKAAIKNIVGDQKDSFRNYFLHNVKIIHYRVPKDVDLNHYFEVMNSRGEQLEKHEIVKASLSTHLKGKSLSLFGIVWEKCSDMNRYIQQKYDNENLFGSDFSIIKNIDLFNDDSGETDEGKPLSDLLKAPIPENPEKKNKSDPDTFQAIIDFPNFLLIVLKLTKVLKGDPVTPESFSLDDKDLVDMFDEFQNTPENAKLFLNNLVKARYFLDNYIVHHVNSDRDNPGDNPWELEYYHKENNNRHPKNLSEDTVIQSELVQLLSLLEVTFTPKTRKNYLFYCLLWLFKNETLIDGKRKIKEYLDFVRSLVDKMFNDIYLNSTKLNESNRAPVPNAFDSVFLKNNDVDTRIETKRGKTEFESIYKYQDGSNNIPLFVFNYTDYKIWKKYALELRGKTKEAGFSQKRESFFKDLGCSDFGLKTFDDFYFSKTRKSLEHYYPQAKVAELRILTDKDINCFGNFAMISSDANSSGSNWDPKNKQGHYLDSKSDPVGTASLKFRIMMKICDDNDTKIRENKIQREKGMEWNKEDMQLHQETMLGIILE